MTAAEVLACCRTLAQCTEEPGVITRTFLSGPMRDVHAQMGAWMQRVGMDVHVDAAGNLRGLYPGSDASAGRWIIGSHLDTVQAAGAFDGILGVVLGIAVVARLERHRLAASLEVIGFSEEEGVRFDVPFIGSRALIGSLDDDILNRRDARGVTVRQAIANFGLDPTALPAARAGEDVRGYFEMHIEQGPVLDSLNTSVGVVATIAGQSRLAVTFDGEANHAGTTPMSLRRDALTGAAEWIGRVEREAHAVAGLVATVGRVEVSPGAGNVVPGSCVATLDVRHADDQVREAAVETCLGAAREIANRRGLRLGVERRLNQPAVPMDSSLTARLAAAAASESTAPVHVMPSGAGHDAMIVAGRFPSAMLFLRTPGGLSHHPDEAVREDDVEVALRIGTRFIRDIAGD